MNYLEKYDNETIKALTEFAEVYGFQDDDIGTKECEADCYFVGKNDREWVDNNPESYPNKQSIVSIHIGDNEYTFYCY